MKMRKVCFLLVIFLLLPSTNSFGAVVKIDDWPLMKEAIKFEDEKNYSKAIYYWEELVKFYSKYETTYAYENSGHYAMKAGKYYEGVYDNKIFNTKQATYYYEKAYNSYLKFSELSGSSKNNWAFIQAKKRLDEIKTTLDLYVQKDAQIIARPLEKFEPVSGMYLGIYGEGNPALINNYALDPALITKTYGTQHASVLYYNEYGITQFPTVVANRMKTIGGSIQIQMQPLKGLASVVDDEYIRTFAKAAKASDIPVFLRFGGEMNGDWVEWGLQPEKYIEKFRLIHDIMEEEAPNVVMVWAPNFFPWDNMDKHYPGDQYVDWVGVSCYTTLNYTYETKESKLKTNPIDLLQYIVKDYGARKPIMIVEGAVSYFAKEEPNINYTAWAVNNLRRFYSYIPLVYPEIKAMYYFDASGQGSEKYILSSNDTLMNSYKDIIKGEYYLSNMGDQVDFRYEKVTNSLEKTKVNLSTYAKAYDPNISKLEYYIDTKLVQTSTKIPYNCTYDFSNHKVNNAKITIKAYNSIGKLIESKDYSIHLVSPDIKVILNNKRVIFDQSPVIKNNRTLVPMRLIFEVLGMKVDYDNTTKKITATDKNNQIILTVGSNIASINGKEEILDVSVEVINNRTLVPVRFISQSLGLNVRYDTNTRQIFVND